MKTLPENPKSAANFTSFFAVKNVQWRGKRYHDTPFAVLDADRADPLIAAWLKAGWIEEMRDGRRVPVATAAASGKIPQTVSAEKPGASVKGAGEFRLIDRSLIDPSGFNPRTSFREQKLEELAASIANDGIVQPLIVRPVQGGRYEIVVGERRWRASGLAWPTGKVTLPCIVREMDKITAIRVAGIENLIRADLNPMEESGWYDTLMHEGGYTVKDIVRETKLSEPTIYARLKLKDCPPEIKSAVAEDRLPPSTAEKVARVEDPELRAAFGRAILHPTKDEPGEEKSGVLSFRQAMRWLEVARQRVAAETQWQKQARACPLAAKAAKVLTAEESEKVVGYGYIKDPNKFVTPTSICHGDPKQRTYQEIAQAAGRELPAPTLAREMGTGKPMAILPRRETEKALEGLVPKGDDLESQRKAEAARKEQKREAERRQREEDERQVQVRAKNVVDAVKRATWKVDRAERLLRFAVGGFLAVLAVDEDDLAAALRELGVPVEKGEEKTVAAPEWRRDYLEGCDVRALYAWLLWFAIRDGEIYSPAVDDDRLWEAEILLGLRPDEPRTSAVEEDEEEDVEEEAA